ncbi:adenylate/guanylate cyclase domain-containing protein [candidate division KSB1 bacterium]|nr:adenylate/guanylate cyclase domain-containing protein [candidate division KSB1 bacterium]
MPEIISIDDESNSLTVLLKPDPRRYEWRELDKKKYLYDKFDNVICPEKVFHDLSRQIVNHRISLRSPEIDDLQEYIEFSKPFIEKALKGYKIIPTFMDRSEEFLQSLESDELTFAIISLDVVGSTTLSISLQPRVYANLISVVLWKLSSIIPKYHGHVLKYTGDGLIAYFPEPSFITKNDLAVDCALALRRLVYKGLDQIFKELGCPPIQVRIGIDTGEAFIKLIGDPSTKQHKDIIGSVVSLAAKIQAMTKPGDIYIGETTCRNLHAMWKENIELVELRDGWNYKGKDGNIYLIYKIKYIV